MQYKYNDSLDRATRAEWAEYLKSIGQPFVEPTKEDLITLGIEKRLGMHDGKTALADQGSLFDKYGNKKVTSKQQFNPLSGNIASVSEDAIMGDDSIEDFTGQGPYFDAESAMNEFADADPLDTTTPNELAFLNDEILESGMPRSELASRVKSMNLSGKSMPRQTPFDERIETGQLALDMGFGGENVPIKQPPALAGSDYVDFGFPSGPTSPAMTAQEQALAQSTRGIDVDSQGNLIPFTEPSSASPLSGDPALYYDTPRPSMTAKADDWYDSFSKNFNKDASSDAFLLGSQLINTYDKDPLLGEDIGGGSLAGITQGGFTGAGLGSQFGPKGALIGAGIGATAGLLGGFDRSSPEPYTETKIIRGSGMAFPQMQSSNYYQGLI